MLVTLNINVIVIHIAKIQLKEYIEI